MRLIPTLSVVVAVWLAPTVASACSWHPHVVDSRMEGETPACLRGGASSEAAPGQDPSEISCYQTNLRNVSGSDCDILNTESLELDPFGSMIAWPDGSSAPTACDLNGNCVDQFDALVGAWTSKNHPVEDILENSRRADHLATSSTSGLTLSSSAGTYRVPLSAAIEYSDPDCHSSACPFYLANLEGRQVGRGVDVQIPYPGGMLKKRVTGVEVDLMHSVLGSYHQAGGWVAMMEGTVIVQLKFTLENTDGNPIGDGTFAKTIENELGPVLAERTHGGVDSVVVQREVIPGVTAVIDLDDATEVEGPPVVAATLPSIVRCDGSTIQADLSAYLSASDPDGDLDLVGWLVDKKSIFAADTGFGNGVYDIAPVAFDARGAVDVGPSVILTVAACP